LKRLFYFACPFFLCPRIFVAPYFLLGKGILFLVLRVGWMTIFTVSGLLGLLVFYFLVLVVLTSLNPCLLSILQHCQMGSSFLYLLLTLLAHALYAPLMLTQGAAVVLLHPQRHAAEVETVVALAPDHDAIPLTVAGVLALSLTPQTSIHDLDSANGARITLHIPAPHCNSFPLF
jgi:hypothetical protein